MKFEDFKISYGHQIKLQGMMATGETEDFTCRLIGCVPGHSVLVTMPRLNKKPVRLRGGQKLVAQAMVANGIGVFSTSVESVSTSPYPVVYLTYPNKVIFKEIRGATRVNSRLAAKIQNLTALNETIVDGVVADISLSGARLELAEEIGDVGDEIEIRGEVVIGPLTRDLVIHAIIRSRVERSTREYDENLSAVYGVEFTESNEDKLLVLYGYVFSELSSELSPV